MGSICIRKEVVEAWLKNKSTAPKTIGEVSEAIGVSPSLLSMIMSHKRQITPSVLKKLCALTGYDVGDLCYYDRTAEDAC